MLGLHVWVQIMFLIFCRFLLLRILKIFLFVAVISVYITYQKKKKIISFYSIQNIAAYENMILLL